MSEQKKRKTFASYDKRDGTSAILQNWRLFQGNLGDNKKDVVGIGRRYDTIH